MIGPGWTPEAWRLLAADHPGSSCHLHGPDDGSILVHGDEITLSNGEGKLQRARSRLYRSEILRPNTHFSGFSRSTKLSS